MRPPFSQPATLTAPQLISVSANLAPPDRDRAVSHHVSDAPEPGSQPRTEDHENGGEQMCMSCGCGEPHETHGDKGHHLCRSQEGG